jgi:UDP-glucose 4-epimerase
LNCLETQETLICNLGTGSGFSVREIVEIARKVSGHPIPVRELPRREGDPAVLVASAEKARRLLGWVPQRSDVESIIQSAWTWHSSHPRGYRSA